MNPQVELDSQAIKDSLLRNGVGKAIVAITVFSVTIFSFHTGAISFLTFTTILSVYILLQIVLDYFIAYSVIIDKGIIALFKRAYKS